MANKTIEGKQCTIVWYVNDNKASHVNPKLIDEIIGYLKVHFGVLVIKRGNKHSFLGITIKITKQIEINTKENLEEVIDNSRKEISGIVSLPAQHHIFTVNG